MKTVKRKRTIVAAIARNMGKPQYMQLGYIANRPKLAAKLIENIRENGVGYHESVRFVTSSLA